MKKFVFVAALLFGTVASMQAQDWGSLLKNAAEKIVSEVTTSETSIVGTWYYASPAMRLESEDELSNIVGGLASASSAVDDKLEPIYQKIGLDQCVFAFNEDGTYNTEMGKIKTSGTYTFDASSKTITMKTKLGMTVTAKATVANQSMTLLFNADKLMSAIKAITGYVGNTNNAMSTITALAKNYDGMSLGFELTTQK